MSGGSWDYAYRRFEEAADRLCGSDDARRRALGRHVRLVAKALRDIEWVDSGDQGKGDDRNAIDDALGVAAAGLILREEIVSAEIMLGKLRTAIDAARAGETR